MKAKDDPRGVAFFAVRPEVGKASSRSITLVPAGSSSAFADVQPRLLERLQYCAMLTARPPQNPGLFIVACNSCEMIYLFIIAMLKGLLCDTGWWKSDDSVP